MPSLDVMVKEFRSFLILGESLAIKDLGAPHFTSDAAYTHI